MTASTPGSGRRPPRERFVGDEHVFDLAAEADALRGEPGGARHGHRQIVLYRGGRTSVLLFDFEDDGFLADHAADGHVTVHVLSGGIRMKTAQREYPMAAGSLLVLEPGVRHDVRATAASRVLLTVHLDVGDD
jgi:quercetin dioxygenase-like cupin family protein